MTVLIFTDQTRYINWLIARHIFIIITLRGNVLV